MLASSFDQNRLADHMGMSIDADALTEAVAMPMAFHRLPVAAYTGAATITPCKASQLVTHDALYVHQVHRAGRNLCVLACCMHQHQAGDEHESCMCQQVL